MSRSRVLAFFLTAMATAALAQGEPQQPRVYALLSAVGNRFEVVQTKPTVGSHLPAVDRHAYEVKENLLNRLVLQGLDRSVAQLDPGSRRIYLSMNPGDLKRGTVPEGTLPPKVLAELRKMDRDGWDRLLVALPAYRFTANDGLGNRMQGLGLYSESQCQSDAGFGPLNPLSSCGNGFRPPSGPEALTPKGETIAANTFVAPFTFIEVFVLDPRTLEVTDRSTQYAHRKVTDDAGSITGIVAGWHDDFLAGQIVQVVQDAAREAVDAAGLRGTVRVRSRGPVEAPPR